MATSTFMAPRMQTNAAWESPPISYRAGSSLALVDISTWTLDGVAVGAKGKRITLTQASGKIVFNGSTEFKIVLSVTDMATLGAGGVTIEIMRRSPAPVRPLLRISGTNKHGVA